MIYYHNMLIDKQTSNQQSMQVSKEKCETCSETKYRPFHEYDNWPIVELYVCAKCGAERFRSLSTDWWHDANGRTPAQLGRSKT